jgi:hypothetical protein
MQERAGSDGLSGDSNILSAVLTGHLQAPQLQSIAMQPTRNTMPHLHTMQDMHRALQRHAAGCCCFNRLSLQQQHLPALLEECCAHHILARLHVGAAQAQTAGLLQLLLLLLRQQGPYPLGEVHGRCHKHKACHALWTLQGCMQRQPAATGAACTACSKCVWSSSAAGWMLQRGATGWGAYNSCRWCCRCLTHSAEILGSHTRQYGHTKHMLAA